MSGSFASSKPIFLLRFCFFITTLVVFSNLSAQKVWINAQFGAANYQGDLQDKRYTFNQAHAMGSLGLLYDITDHFTARALFSIGKLSGDDKYGKNSSRNLNFTTNLFEAQLGMQYYLFPLGEKPVTPYAFASVALYKFDPYTFDTSGTKHYLRPLSTEGQGFIEGKDYYNLSQFAIPFGGGVKLSLSENVNVGLEIGLRKLFTDYLDDVSTVYVDRDELIANRGEKAAELAYRGDELKNGSPYPAAGTFRASPKQDWYYVTSLTLSLRLPAKGTGLGFGRKRSQFGCPVNVR